jgi:UDP-glucose 4-epimerase
MRKRVLITGANGFIGSALLRRLEDTKWEVISLNRKGYTLKNEVVLDFCDEDFYVKIDSLPKVDAVIHLGARIGWDGSSRSDLFVPNVLATAELARWSNKIGAYFIFASAAIICGLDNPYIKSDSKPKIDSDYGYSKWLAEELIRMSGVKYAILRIGGAFGRNGPKHLSLNLSIDNAFNGIRPIQYGEGKQKRNYIYVEDLADVLLYCLENRIEGTHLVAGSNTSTVSEMLETICHILLPDKKPEYKAGDNSNSRDQIIEHSQALLKGRSFVDAICDLNKDVENVIL